MVASDKKLLFGSLSHTHGADLAYDQAALTIIDNSSGQVSYVIDDVDVQLEIVPNSQSKYYYAMIFVTDPTGNIPTGLDGANIATLNTWLQNYRKQIWMSVGGYAKFNAALADEKTWLRMNAKTKRTLKPGQKLILVVITANATSSSADSDFCVYDIGVFYHY